MANLYQGLHEVMVSVHYRFIDSGTAWVVHGSVHQQAWFVWMIKINASIDQTMDYSLTSPGVRLLSSSAAQLD